MARPIDIVRKLCPKAKPSYLAAFETGDALFAAADITTSLRLAHFLAQALHETGGLSIEWESGAYSAPRLMQIFGVGHHSAAITEAEAQTLARRPEAIFERVYGLGNPRKAKELGNTQPGDGYRYRGGGVLQTTGRANYRRMGVKCGVDFEANPELVLSAEHALKPALAEWSEGKLNAAADRDDILAITKRINGGTNGLQERKDWLRRIKPLVLVVDLKPAAAGTVASPIAAPDEPAPGRTIDPDKFARVRALQESLVGPPGLYDGAIDGDLGPKTVKAFQRSVHLDDDGVVGKKTRPLLDAALAAAVPVKP